MKKLFHRLTAFIFILVLLSGLGQAFAVDTDYVDVKGHWAENTLLRAVSDALIKGEGNSLKPNDPISCAEILAILCRVLSATRAADISGLTDISKDDPHYAAVSQAAALGIISPMGSLMDLDKPVTRGRAFTLLAEAFQLNTAVPDTSVLSAFTDGTTLSGAYRPAVASLVSLGFVEGSNGALHINNTISRAEFLTVLYKILPNYLISDTNDGAISGGTVLSGKTVLSDVNYSGNVYFDCSTSAVRLQNITAPSVILRSDSLNALAVFSSKIDRLIFASAGGDLQFNPGSSTDIQTVVVGTGGGKITFGAIPNLEITGSNREVLLTGPVQNLIVSGSGNTITIAPGVMVDAVKILASGSGNTVIMNGFMSACTIYGSETAVNGNGTIQKLLDNSKDSAITANVVTVATNKDYGLSGVALTLAAPDDIASYETLEASVSINATAGSTMCRGAWYLDDKLLSQSDVDICASPTVSLNSDIANNSDKPVTGVLSFVLSFSDSDGNYQEMRADKSVTLLGKTKFDAAAVLALVTTGYKGDYTLAWAQSNDYEAGVKTAWVNAKGYSSRTNYLVWVNITHQRVNVFTGSAGNWSLDKTFIVGTGASGKDTPTGVFKVIGRSTRGWTTKAYTVKPVIFFLNSAYGFHSRLYDPGTTKINDARIGFPISHGCVRMYDEDVAWFYDNIPTNTTVVVY